MNHVCNQVKYWYALALGKHIYHRCEEYGQIWGQYWKDKGKARIYSRMY